MNMTLDELFRDYQTLPEYSGVLLDGVFCTSLFGDRPIHVAAIRGSIEELSVLVENGATIDEHGEHGYTPLHDAVEQGHIMAVNWLLSKGASKTLRNDYDQTPLDLAVLLGERKIAEVLI